MRRHHALLYVLLATLCFECQLPAVHAAIVISGDVDPDDPANWNNSTFGYVGYFGTGTVEVNGGSNLYSSFSNIGTCSGSTGIVTVDGTGSTWANNLELHVGHQGSGTLKIANGADVTVGGRTYVAMFAPSTGAINFDSGGGTLTTQTLFASPTQLTGTGTINTRGLVSDINLVFDSTHGLSQALTLDSQSGQNITVNLTMSNPSSNGDIGVGYKGNGTLRIQDGVMVHSQEGWIGWHSGSTGEVTLNGTGSMWTNEWDLYLGYEGGNGTLNIIGGAAVSDLHGRIGYASDSISVATVTGIGSTWLNSGFLLVGKYGSGTLNISDSGVVTAINVSINSQSLLTIDVGNSSLLNVGNGSGTLTNNGVVRVIAGAGPIADATYSPISAGIWDGSGIYQAVGGTWNETTHEFTVSDVLSGNSGSQLTLDLAVTQRALIADGGEGHTGWSLGASFLHKTGENTDLDFTATVITGETLDGLVALLDSGESVEGAWELIVAGDGYTEGDPAYLSFDVGAGYSRGDLQVWHFDGFDWTEFDAIDLTCNGDYASFTVTGFSGYAVSAVPEPGMFILLIAAALGLLIHARRKRK